MANQRLTYILWFFFGWTGLHHVYLGRLNQAIVWFATLGGGCGVGWVRDYWRIPDYLEWCNGEKSAQLRYLDRAIQKPRPGCSLFRFAGMVVMGLVASTILGALVPDFYDMPRNPLHYIYKWGFLAMLILGNAIGVYAVSNIGELQCTTYYPFLTSTLITPWLLGNNPNMLLPCFLTAFVTWYKGIRWRPVTLQSEKTSRWEKIILCKNVTCYIFACSVWLFILIAGVYFNTYVTVEGGEKVPVREALSNFFKSEAWRRTKDSLYHLFTVYWHSGAGRAWRDFNQLFDFTGEISAYRVLGLDQTASRDAITKRCRKLSAENHPDRFKTQTEKDAAQERFYEIQHACSALSSSLARRSRNMKAPVD